MIIPRLQSAEFHDAMLVQTSEMNACIQISECSQVSHFLNAKLLLFSHTTKSCSASRGTLVPDCVICAIANTKISSN